MAAIPLTTLSVSSIRTDLKAFIHRRVNGIPGQAAPNPTFAAMLASFSDTFNSLDSLSLEGPISLQTGFRVRGTFFFTCKDAIYSNQLTNNSAEIIGTIDNSGERPRLTRIVYAMNHPKPRRFRLL